ncbi:hypothetical protein ACOSQ2_018841 [Xanthoceras sorbifolium]
MEEVGFLESASLNQLVVKENRISDILALKTGLMNDSEEMASALVQIDDYTKAGQEQRQCIMIKKSLEMISGAFYVPKDRKLKPLGEDAHFLYPENETIAVANGAGSWANVGVDSGEFARKLMINAVIAIRTEPKGAIDPKKILTKAYTKTEQKGASTACIITLSGHNLHAANVGDSGFMVIRHGAVIYQSPELEVTVKSGDVIITGTDGLFDNLFPCEILRAVIQGIEGGFKRIGGKVDDITMIVAYIV